MKVSLLALLACVALLLSVATAQPGDTCSKEDDDIPDPGIFAGTGLEDDVNDALSTIINDGLHAAWDYCTRDDDKNDKNDKKFMFRAVMASTLPVAQQQAATRKPNPKTPCSDLSFLRSTFGSKAATCYKDRYKMSMLNVLVKAARKKSSKTTVKPLPTQVKKLKARGLRASPLRAKFNRARRARARSVA